MTNSDWQPGGGLNKAHEAIDRHANGRNRDKIAMIWEGKNGEKETYTFGQMKEQSNKFANVLKSLGIEKGDRVFIYMERLPELYFAFFGILKVGAIAGPLFSAFGPDPVKDRMLDSEAKVLVTQPDLRRKITPIIPELFELQHMVIVNKAQPRPAAADVRRPELRRRNVEGDREFRDCRHQPVRLLNNALTHPAPPASPRVPFTGIRQSCSSTRPASGRLT